MRLDDLLQRDPFGEKLITITGHNLNQTQIDKFLARMSKYAGSGERFGEYRRLGKYLAPQLLAAISSVNVRYVVRWRLSNAWYFPDLLQTLPSGVIF